MSGDVGLKGGDILDRAVEHLERNGHERVQDAAAVLPSESVAEAEAEQVARAGSSGADAILVCAVTA